MSLYSHIQTVLLISILTYETAKGQQCDQPLGFRDGRISDSQISASSSSYLLTADQARYETGSGWIPAPGTLNQYLEVDLLTPHRVTQYLIQGAKNSDTWYVRSLALYYSQDGFTWERYVSSTGSSLLGGPPDSSSVGSVDLIPPIEARFLVFQPRNGQGLRLELMGCELDQQNNATISVISEDIENKQEWMLSESPYIINSKITIKRSGHIKVQPGVKVIFNSTDAGLVIDGTLEAVGQSPLPVEFGYPRPFSHQAGQWAGLQITLKGNLKLEHCNIYGATTGVKAPLRTIVVRHSHIHENNIGVELTSGDSDRERIQLTDTRIANNSEQGIRINDWSKEDIFMSMNDCQIVENGDSGLRFDTKIILYAENCAFTYNNDHGVANNNDSEYYVTMTFNKCRFTNNRGNGFYLDFSSSSSNSLINITVSDSQVSYNRFEGMVLNLYRPPRGMAITVKDSHIYDNKGDGIRIRAVFDKDDATVRIINNTLSTADTYPHGYIYHLSINSNSTGAEAKVIIQDNTLLKGKALWVSSASGMTYMIANNRITTTSLYPETVGMKITGTGGDITLYENRFVNCTSRVLSVHTPVKITRNIFLNPRAVMDVDLDLTFSDGDRINVSHNYWGSSDMYYVRSRVCDFFCDMNRIIADVHPFYTTESMTELSTEVDSDLFFQTSDTIGGILTESLKLNPHQYLFVNRTIYIPKGYKLIIGENVTLVFVYPANRGILVQGSLDIQGTENNKVMLIAGPIDNSKWNGIKISGTGSSIRHAVIQDTIAGVNITGIKSPISLTISDTLFTRGSEAITGNLNFDTDLLLHRVKVKYSYAALSMVMTQAVIASVVMSQCQIESSAGILVSSVYSAGHLNISISSTNITTDYKPCISSQACNTKVTMMSENSTFISGGGSPFADIASSLLNIDYRHVSGSGGSVAARLQVCPVMNHTVDSGIIDIKDSDFRATENNYALDLGSFSYPIKLRCVKPHDIILVNNTFITQSDYASVHIETGGNCSSWNALIMGNSFKRSGIDIIGIVSNTTIEENTFDSFVHTTISVDLLGYETTTTSLVRNQVNGGSVILSSGRRNDIFNMEKNVFTGSNIYITTSNVRMYENTLHEGLVDFRSQVVDVHDIQLNAFNGSQLYFQTANMIIQKNIFLKGPHHSLYFASNCYSEGEVNCSLNYWGTKDEDAIASRIYDSENDKNLPKINFVPFYGYPNLTDLQYPVDSFFSPDGNIGGSIAGTVTLTASGSPYNVTDNIIVESMGKLILEAGVKLMFTRWIGITVSGTLRILGTSSQPVIAQPLVEDRKWSGIKVLKPTYRPETVTPPKVRLVNGCDGKEGRLEVKQEETWGTVCGHHFDEKEAKVVCRMLGYDPSVTHQILPTGDFGQGTGDILMGGLECEGTENSLEECPMSTFNCSHQQDVALRCNGKLLPTREEVGNEVELRHLSMMNTEMGLELDGNVTTIENVSSTDSSRHGITIKRGIVSPLRINGLSTVRNRYSGLAFETESLPVKGRYMEVSISNCDFSFNSEYGIHILNSVNMSLENCQFSANRESAIYLKSEAIIDISHSQFERNERGVFNMNELKRFQGFLHFSLKDSQLVGNVGRHHSRIYNVIKLFPIYTEPCRYEFVNNVFSNNHGNVLFLNTYRSTLSNTLHIINNTFQSNSAGVVLVESAIRNSVNVFFMNNTVKDNMASDDHLIKVNIGTSLREIGNNASHMSISKNIFSNNSAPKLIGVRDVAGFQSNISITRNSFSNNNSSRTLTVTAKRPSVTFNVFNNPLALCELESPTFIRGFDIDARWNYWGSPDVEFVVSKLCGFDTDMVRGFIYYLPFYLSGELSERSEDTEFWIRNLLGGVVERQIQLNVSASPLHIKRSIYIREEGELAIESGVEMQFEPDTGIYVDGILIAGGSAHEKVTLTRAQDIPWHGIVFPYKTAEVKKSVRLEDGSMPYEGRVEICNNGSWTDVCRIDYSASELVCQALGYRGVWAFLENSFGKGNKTKMVDLKCGKASALSECQIEPQPNISLCNPGAGVTCRQFVVLPGPDESSYLESVSILGSKEGLLIQTPTVRLSKCHINNTEKAGVTLETVAFDIDFDLNGTVVENGKSDGILVRVSKKLRIVNGTTQFNHGKGMYLERFGNKAVIGNMTFASNYLFYNVANTYSNKRLHVSDSLFKGQESGLRISMKVRSDHDANVFIEKNQFLNTGDDAVQVSMTGSRDSSGSKRLFIRRNDFKSPISVTSQTNLSIHVEDNTAENINIGEQCFLLLDVMGSGRDYDHAVSISGNYFENISGDCVAHLKSTKHSFKGSFDYNKILNSSLSEATVLLESMDFNLSYNAFHNPRTQFELKVFIGGDEEIKAENNFWGNVNAEAVGARILDKRSNTNLVSLDYTPVLVDIDFDCSAVNDCNGNGRCVSPNGCWCEVGWAGVTCTDFDCSDLDNCSGKGECAGPNLCECLKGSAGQLCDVINNEVGDNCSVDMATTSTSILTSTSMSASTTAVSTDSVPGVSRSTSIHTSLLWIISTLTLILTLLGRGAE